MTEPDSGKRPARGGLAANLKEDARFAGRETEDWKRTLGTFLGVWGAVILGSSTTLGLYAFGTDSWLTRGPILFAVVCIVVSFALTYQTLTQRMSQRRAQSLGLTAGFTAALVAFLGGAHYMLAQQPMAYDVSERSVHSLSEQTLKVLETLDTPVRFVAFYERTDEASGVFETMSQRYRRHSKKVEFVRYSPTYDIEKVQEYKVTSETPPVVVESRWSTPEERRETRFGIDMKSLRHEQQFTNGIMSVTLNARKKILITTGHGEADPLEAGPKGFKDTADDLRNEGYDIIRINLIEVQKLPEDVAAIIVPGPTQRFLEPERKTLSRYLGGGGRVALLLEQGGFEHGLDELIGAYGVQANKDIILDVSDYGKQFGPTNALATSYANHPITAKFQKTTSLFPESRSLSINPVPGVSVTPLVRTSAKTWGETDFESIARGDAGWDAGEARGPVTLAVAAERVLGDVKEGEPIPEDTPRTRLTVFGDSSFSTNEHRRMGANRNLVLNMVGWLVDDESQIAIRPRSRGSNLIVLTPNQRDGIFFFVLYVLPVSLLSIGLGIWLVRRQR
jgi:hypothetical protein